jgi:hypothetical protein
MRRTEIGNGLSPNTYKAASRTSSFVAGAKHEMIDDQLLAALEEVCQCVFALEVLEGVFLIDLHHGEVVSKLGIEGILSPRSSFLLHEKFLASSQPLLARDDLHERRRQLDTQK